LEGKNAWNSDGTGNMIVQEGINIQTNDGGKHKRKDRPNGGMYVNSTDTSLTLGSTDKTVIQETTGTLTQSYDGDQSAGDTDKLVVQDTCGTISGGAHPSGFNGQDAYTGNVVGYAVTSKWAKGSGGPSGSGSETNNCVQTSGAVRRLTPVECARLQGFPDDWNEEVSDAQRYKQFGNAVTVPVAKWIGERILKCQGK